MHVFVFVFFYNSWSNLKLLFLTTYRRLHGRKKLFFLSFWTRLLKVKPMGIKHHFLKSQKSYLCWRIENLNWQGFYSLISCLEQTLSRDKLCDDDDKNFFYPCLCYFVEPESVVPCSVKSHKSNTIINDVICTTRFTCLCLGLYCLSCLIVGCKASAVALINSCYTSVRLCYLCVSVIHKQIWMLTWTVHFRSYKVIWETCIYFKNLQTQNVSLSLFISPLKYIHLALCDTIWLLYKRESKTVWW